MGKWRGIKETLENKIELGRYGEIGCLRCWGDEVSKEGKGEGKGKLIRYSEVVLAQMWKN